MYMQTMQTETKTGTVKSLLPGLVGVLLLTPASYFMLTMLIGICGAKSFYHWISPSFLQSPSALFSLHKAQFIIGCLVLGIACNLFAVVRVRLERGARSTMVALSFRRNWLNTAVALQGGLLLVTLIMYTVIQHIRY